jgi:hypothetical protein
MTAQGVDASAHLSGAAVKAAGYVAAGRYISPNTVKHPQKRIDVDELADLHAHGLSVWFVWETTEGRAAEGGSAGEEDTLAANAWLDHLGAPADVDVYLAIDSDLTEPAVRAYFTAATAASKRPLSVYGPRPTVNALLAERLAVHGWYAGGWTHGAPTSSGHVQQLVGAISVGGVACDLDNILKPIYGQWSPVQHDSERARPSRKAHPMFVIAVAGEGFWLASIDPQHGKIACPISSSADAGAYVGALGPAAVISMDELATYRILSPRGGHR